MKHYFLTFYLLLFSLLCFSQVKVRGKVVEKGTNFPLEYATVTFRNPVDNQVVTGAVTDENGVFNLEIEKASYTIKFEYISYKSVVVTRDVLSPTDFGAIELELDVETLEQIEIVAERTSVEIKLDKKIYNVGKDLTVRGGTVSDVLDNIPSVSVDVEGVVALRGNEDVRILINGKPSGLVGLNNSDALRQLPADAIERVEVITAPSGRYDAEGTAGILNIILRRSKLQGFNGAVTANAGHPARAGIAGNVNFRTGDFNFFNTSSYIYRVNPGMAYTFTEYFSTNTSLEENREFERQQNSFNTNLGLEYFINESTTLTTSIQYRNADEENETVNNINEFDANNELLNAIVRIDPEFADDKTLQYGIDFDKYFGDDTNHKFIFSFQLEDSEELEQSLIIQDGEPVEDVTTDEKQDRLFFQSDYVLPVSDVSQIELGYQGRFLTLDTDYVVLFADDNGDFILNEDLSNNLVYKEYVNAAYAQFGSKIKDKFSYLLGLRMEHSNITIDQVTSGDFDKKNYTNLFPSVNLAYEFSEDQNLTLGFNRRIRRPRSRFINPFPSRSSATNLFQGNPDLDPSYSNVLDLGYYENYGKLSLNGSIYYSHATDVFVFITEETGDTVLIGDTEIPVLRRTPINLATNDRYGFEFTLTWRPTKKWNINGNFNFFQSITEGEFEGTDFGAENLSWFVRLNNKYTLPGKIDWQTRVNYRGPREDAQNRTEGIFSMNMAFSKDFFKDKASLTFTINDIFNSRIRRVETLTPSFRSDRDFQRRVRAFNLAFTYRLNQKKKRQRNQNSGQGEDDGAEF